MSLPDPEVPRTQRTWAWMALAVGAGIAAVVVIFVVFGNLLDRGAPPANSPGASASSASAEPTQSTTSTSSLAPTNEPTAGWAPVRITGVPWVDGIAEREGRLVAVGHTAIDGGNAVIAYSDDGLIWSPVDTAALGIGNIGPQGPNNAFTTLRITAGEPGFVAVGSRIGVDFSVEDLYLFSADGRDWQFAEPPEECSAGYGIRAVGSGFVDFGGVCIVEGATPPGPMRVVTSTDGRSWTLRIQEEMFAAPWTTDGDRIVMLDGCCGDPDRPDIAISDDGAATWRRITDPFPAGISVGTLAWGHQRYVAEASWINVDRPGDPDHAVCASDTGESWTCQALSSVSAAAKERRAVGPVVPTATGFASVLYVLDDQSGLSGVTAVLATSTDGLAWTFETVPAMKDGLLGGLLGSSHGAFAWGSSISPDGSAPQEPFLFVHVAPLP